ncbi:LCP family protein [Clostridium gasigenes]|uniref:LCP family protein n=1 Tax=Clostridium gasigenes TaxID=94869 RepID=UPI001C0DC479|nr:LCP family protein [Clostridium gasigenes]MBU3108879.1 LCP family protein [Clostridium gasigenes]
MRKSQKNRNIKKKKSTLKITLISLITLVVVTLLGGVFYSFYLSSKLDKVDLKNTEIGITNESTQQLSKYDGYDQIMNIALFGIDAGDNELGRSDSIMVLTVDPVHNKLKLSSIMRDSYVNIPGHGMDKLNHAFAFGNSVLALQTLNDNFNINVNNFVSTNFSNLPKIIDKLEGVTINITAEEVPLINNYAASLGSSKSISGTGPQLLSGDLALAYTRIRYTAGGDYERTLRQRTVLSAVFDKVKSTPVTEMPSLLNDFLPFVQTSFSSSELLKLGTTVSKMSSSKIIEDRFPRDDSSQGKTIDGIYYLTFDAEATKSQMQQFIYEN